MSLPDSNKVNQLIQVVQTISFNIFSWVILNVIAVIVAGKCLSQRLRMRVGTLQTFKIPLIILRMEANGQEVILGFGGFFATFLPIALFAGPQAHDLVRLRFGLETSQFQSLCIISAFTTVVWSFILYVLLFLTNQLSDSAIDSAMDQHGQLLKEITQTANAKATGHARTGKSVTKRKRKKKGPKEEGPEPRQPEIVQSDDANSDGSVLESREKDNPEPVQ